MENDTPAPERDATHNHLIEENRLLAQRYLELENSTRRQIEKLRSANDILTKGEAHMRLLLENADVGFALLDLNMRIVSANATLCSMLGYSQSELPGENFNNFVYVGKLPAFSRLTGQAAGRTAAKETIELVAKDGRLVACRVAVSDWLDDRGAARGSFILAFGIDDEMRVAARLRDMEAAMAEAEKARTLFLDVVSRELRTPARGIMGMVRMLMDADLNERQSELAGVIHSSASSLVRLVDDIVDVVRIDAGELRAAPAPLNPTELAEGAANLFGVRADEKGVELRVHISSAVPETVVADGRQLRRVLVHLLDNAFKYTDRGHISITVDVIGESLRFMVSDTGSGIEPAPDRDIFGDPVFEDSASARRHGGVGVGLSLSRRLVSIMGGKIGYESEPGRGSEFHFTIPLVSHFDSPVAGLEPPPEAMRLPAMSILLADGNPLSSGVVKAYLQFDGHALTLVDNGLEAAEKCRQARFDLVILDLNLPKLDALQTLRIIRDDEKATGRSRVPALILAPAGRVREDGFYQRVGADGVVGKPVRPVDLMAAVAAATGAAPVEVARQKAPGQYAAESRGASLRRVDGAQLANLRQIMPRDQFHGVLRFFMEDAVPGIIGIAELTAHPEPDPERVAFAASKARGFAGHLGFTALAELLERIENAGRRRAPADDLRRLVCELPMVMDDSMEELKRVMPESFATISAMSGPLPESTARSGPAPDNTGQDTD